MAEETMERSTNSVLNFDAITAEEITNAAECVLWLLKGTGSDRDKQLTLAVLREWLQTHFGNTTIDGKLNVVGEGGGAELTNLLFKLATAAGDMQMTAAGATFTDESLAGYSFSVGRAGVSMTNGKLTLTINTSGEIRITQKNAQDVVTSQVTVSKYGVAVTDGSSTFLFGLDSGVMKVQGNEGAITTISGTTATYLKVSTRKLRREWLNLPISYTLQGTQGGINASTIQSSITTSTVLVFNDGISSVGPRNINLDWTPAEDTELVIDFQSTNADYLIVNNGGGTSEPIVNQAPNSVRRYVYKGGTTGWVCLY